jgi:CSLREA domain-containing protein
LGAGGALYAVGNSATLLNSTISGNAAQVTGTNARAHGGGVYASHSLQLSFSTIIGNTTSSVGLGAIAAGGGIFTNGALDVSNSIVADNLSTEAEGDVHVGGEYRFRYSLLSDGDGTALAETLPAIPDSHGNFVGGPKYGVINAGLGPLENNGGRTSTHLPQFGSPALSTGDPMAVPGVGGTPLFDQRGAGFARRHGVRVDMGAAESKISTFVVDTLTDESNGNYDAGDLSLREALELANASSGEDMIEFSPSLFAAGPQTLMLAQRGLLSTGSIDLRGPGANLLTIDASGNDPTPDRVDGRGSFVFLLTGSPSTSIAVLSGLRLTGGDFYSGGGVSSAIDLALVSVEIIGNSASFGSGLYTTGSLTMINSRVADNEALIGSAVEIFHDRRMLNPALILHSIIENNATTFPNAGAGGIQVSSNSNASPWLWHFEMADSIVRNNTGAARGGVFVDGARTVRISNSTISNNTSLGGGRRADLIGLGKR